jgi:transcriptional regulator with XRE-family HTH domain
MSDVGKLIKERRQQLGLTLEDVGQKVGVGKSTVRKWEEGTIRSIRSDKLEALADALQLKPVDLVPAKKKPSFAELTADMVGKKVVKVGSLESHYEEPLDVIREKPRPFAQEVIGVTEDPELKALLKVWKVSTPAAKKSAIEVLKVMNKTSKKE